MTGVVSKAQGKNMISETPTECRCEMLSVRFESVPEGLTAEFSESLLEKQTAGYQPRAAMVARAFDMIKDEFSIRSA